MALIGRKGLLLGGAGFLFCFCLTPVLYLTMIAVSARAPVQGGFTPTLEHFRNVLLSPSLDFPRHLLNSIGIAAIGALLTIVIAVPAAYALVNLRVPGASAVLLATLAISMLPPVSMAGFLFRLMTQLGWINTWQALILPYAACSLPLSLWILTSYFKQIPPELDQAALVDGASRVQALLRISLPVAAPAVASTFLLSFIFAFNEFLFASMFTIDSAARTVPVATALFEGLHGEIAWGEIMAASVLAASPVVLLTLIFQQRIVEGLSRGAVKG
jgi:multiple sugar transport system permease protein